MGLEINERVATAAAAHRGFAKAAASSVAEEGCRESVYGRNRYIQESARAEIASSSSPGWIVQEMITIVKLVVMGAVQLFHSFSLVDTSATIGTRRCSPLSVLAARRLAAQPLHLQQWLSPIAIHFAFRLFLSLWRE
ncbi:MAG TPA: hypothetical protein VFB10_14655 [Candidatus Dormibacteraeota bacterium]|nr:hypothetical protein [Candidatus Dormibacteraeota bacterium]